MPITFNCPCGKTLKVPDEHAGRRAKCPVCSAAVPVPGPDPVFEIVEKPQPGSPNAGSGTKPTVQPTQNNDDDSDDRGTYRIAR
jgi:hypothetical protein